MVQPDVLFLSLPCMYIPVYIAKQPINLLLFFIFRCGNVFARPERLKRHMEFRHSQPAEWKFKCVICGRGCAGKKSYKSHMLKKHAITGPIEELTNMDPTPFMTDKPKRSKTVRAMKQELTDINDVVAVHQLQRVQQQVQQVQQQVQQVQHPQAFAVCAPQEMQVAPTEDVTAADQEHLAAVASVINQQQPAASLHPAAQPQQLPRNVTIVHGLQNPNDGQNTIYLSIPGNIGEKDQIVAATQQNLMNFPQLVMAPPGAIQTHGAHQMAAAAPAQGGLHVLAAAPQQNNQPHATPVQTVLMATHPAPIQQQPVEVSAATAVPVSMQQVINAQTPQSFQGFAGFTNYDQYQPQL